MIPRCSLFVLLTFATYSLSAQAPEEISVTVKAWAALLQGMAQIEKYVTTGELGSVHSEVMPLAMATSVLLRETQPIQASARDQSPVSFPVLTRKVNDLHAAADAFDQRQAEELLAQVLLDCQSLKEQSGREMVAAAERLAARHMCPMHPEVTGRSADRCPKCGMDLDQPVRVPLNEMSGTPVRQTVRARIRTVAPIQRGQPVDAVLELDSFGRPVETTDLRVVHTERIHLLIIDPSLTDYHHVHPEPTEKPGEYRFRFTPMRAAPYRAWADVRSTITGLQEYALADIGSNVTGDANVSRSVTVRADVEGLRFELELDAPSIRVAQATRAKIRIFDAVGRPFTALEPVMGAFAHVVGFADDYKSVIHTHPIARRLLTSSDRGGPELEFQLYATRAGFYRLFVQIQTGGKSLFAPFGLEVFPAN
jgi:Heavy metal binding domain